MAKVRQRGARLDDVLADVGIAAAEDATDARLPRERSYDDNKVLVIE